MAGVLLFELESSEILVVVPRVVNATAQSTTVVRVSFDVEMRHVSAGNDDDALNPANYVISVAGGVPRTVSSVALFAGSPTLVDLTLNGEMTDGAAYEVTVSNVKSAAGELIDSQHDDWAFSGIGVLPEVSSATALTINTVRVIFNETMRDNTALVNKSNYVIGGYAAVVVTSVVKESLTQVILHTETTMKTGEIYSVTVSNVQDAGWNPLNPAHDEENFTGIGDHPKLLSSATSVDPQHVRIQFSEDVVGAEATDITNYEIDGGALSVISVAQETGDTFVLETAAQNPGTAYTITVLAPGTPTPTGIHDFIGNDVRSPYNTVEFLSVGTSPPIIEILPSDAARNIPVRTTLRLTFKDTEEEFSGINKASIWVRVLYTDADGISQTVYAVKDGNVLPQFIGEETGDPLSAEGISYEVIPRSTRWEANTLYTVQAYARDLESTTNVLQQTFRTYALRCFEDILPPAAPIDTQLLQPLPYQHLEKLRNILLKSCTRSQDENVQARTLLYVASVTNLRTTIARYVDFGLVDSIRLCDRRSILSIQQDMLRYWGIVRAAVDEVPNITKEGRALLLGYTKSRSSVYAINAIAAAVVLAAAQQGV